MVILRGINKLIRTAFVEFDQQVSKDNSKELHNNNYKDQIIRVEDCNYKLPAFLGRRGYI